MEGCFLGHGGELPSSGVGVLPSKHDGQREQESEGVRKGVTVTRGHGVEAG